MGEHLAEQLRGCIKIWPIKFGKSAFDFEFGDAVVLGELAQLSFCSTLSHGVCHRADLFAHIHAPAVDFCPAFPGFLCDYVPHAIDGGSVGGLGFFDELRAEFAAELGPVGASVAPGAGGCLSFYPLAGDDAVVHRDIEAWPVVRQDPALAVNDLASHRGRPV
ncbi:MAG: hypothetical protein COB69_10645 [Phycisphaera sp.]|nr:MAG: hypothetical protein COB69_10645 [Phycisphaera sp.]